ncbi:hypothetical protein [Caulobacter hibisci]|uniref:Uncharacterized protein n=1 Tax=Caulobacter hibisci TaxID=2035993 RepID=A0ABS0SZ16_9CAUL|nr:hypothetical protein [Caulobacter hibisci]MBI1684681.1 hypothetical protein [Caulobacter hibisci]
MSATDESSLEAKIADCLLGDGQARPADLIHFLDRAPDAPPMEGDALDKAP